MDSWSLEDYRMFQLYDITHSVISRYRISKRIFRFCIGIRRNEKTIFQILKFFTKYDTSIDYSNQIRLKATN